jgi:hypothetical protein
VVKGGGAIGIAQVHQQISRLEGGGAIAAKFLGLRIQIQPGALLMAIRSTRHSARKSWRNVTAKQKRKEHHDKAA